MSNDPDRTDASQISRDRSAIRAWADQEGVTPMRHREEEAYRIADEGAGESHERVEWDEFHTHLEDEDRVVIYHGEAAEEPLEVAPREDAVSRSNVSDEDLEERLLEGETVTSTVTETAVVEEVVVEEATIESELIDTEITDDSVVDAELLSRDVTDCYLEETGAVDAGEWFDADRYLSTIDEPGETTRMESTTPTGTTRTGSTTDTETAGDEDSHPVAGTTTTEPSTSDTVTSDARTEEDLPSDVGTADRGPDTTDDEMGRTDTTATDDEMGQTDTTAMDDPATAEPMGTGTTDTETTDTGTADTERTEVDRMETGERTRPERTYTDVDEEYPYTAALEVEEAWAVTREFTERHIVESRVADVDVAESDSIEERDIDVEGLQRNLAESDLIGFDLSPEEILEESDVETEFTEDDRIRTHFDRSRIVEDEVVDRRHLRADVTGVAEMTDFERVSSTAIAAETTEGAMDDTTTTGTRDDETTRGEAMDDTTTTGTMDEEATSAGTMGATGETEAIPLSDDEIGKDVVDANEETVGMVTDISDDGTTMYVDAHPGITGKIKAALDWSEADDDDYPVEVEQIDHVTEDEIQLKGAEELEEIGSPTP